MGWEQRLYSFLLRRVLGPYLNFDSLQKLHKLTEVSLQEGKISLCNIELNTNYLNSKQNKVLIKNINVERLEIKLSLGNESKEEEKASVAWRAIKLSTESTGITLLAHVNIVGVEIQVEPPCQTQKKYENSEKEGQEKKTASSSILSSYIDAAMSSLQLSINLKNILIRMTNKEKWIQINMNAVKYYDQKSQEFTICKSLEISGSSMEIFEENCREMVAKLDGSGQISLKVKYPAERSKSIMQDIAFNFNRRLNISVEEKSLFCILNTIDAYMKPSEGKTQEVKQELQTPIDIFFDDEKDEQSMREIMDQYVKARELVERNEIRGGILVADTDTASFDAFFDANDVGSSSYKSIFEESLVVLKSYEFSGTDYFHTNLNFYLGECRIKVSFPKQQNEISVEYLLMTFREINITSTISNKSSKLNFTINQIEVESSLISPTSRPEIQTIFCFEQNDDPNNVVFDGPCLDFRIKYDNTLQPSVELRLQKLQVVYNHGTMKSFTSMINKLSTEKKSIFQAPSSKSQKNCAEVSIWIGSVTLLFPVLDEVPDESFRSLFERCGYFLSEENLPIHSSLGFSFEDILVSSQDTEIPFDIVEGYEVSCQRALLFVTAPFRGLQGTNKFCRLDMLSLSGQLPLSIKYRKMIRNNSTALKENLIFPKIPAISSFKAREDDDNDDDDDIGMSYKSEIVTSLRSPDPQATILKEVAKCQRTVEVNISDLCIDLTKNEIFHLRIFISSCVPQKNQDDKTGDIKPQESEESSKYLEVSICIDQMTFCAHKKTGSLTMKVIGRGWKLFTTLKGSKVQCLRALAQDADIYFCQQLIYCESNKYQFEAKSISYRCDLIRQRTIRNVDTKALPVLYRSQLYPPLSPENPAILLDLINGPDESCKEWTIHFTVYNMTHRFCVDSTWHAHLSSFLKFDDEDEVKIVRKLKTCSNLEMRGSTLTKIFVTFADCNIDYSTPTTFNTSSRSILRISDVRLSSNLITPPQPIQTFRLSVNDASLLIGNKRYSYNAENVHLFRSATTLCAEDLDVVNIQASPDLLQMHLITIFTLDSFVAAVSLNSREKQTYLQDHGLIEPKTTAQLTFGQICVHGCKDSLECITETLGELSLKITGLTKDDMLALKMKRAVKDSVCDEKNSDSSGDQYFDSNQGKVDEINKSITHDHNANRDKEIVEVTTLSDEKDFPDDEFELDGYDWTTIDNEWSKNELPEGEDQAARWYSDRIHTHQNERINVHSNVSTVSEQALIKPKLISHYIQVKPSFNSLSEGDMEAARHAGTPDAPPVSIRILIHNLKVRCRFFDGYDWPQDVSKSRHSTNNLAFVIDRMTDEKKNNGTGKDEETLQNTFENRKNILMEALLEAEPIGSDQNSPFRDILLPEERGNMLKNQAEQRRLERRINRFLQVSLSGLNLRVDTFQESQNHRLASCVEMKIEDFFIAETITDVRPLKLLGEWSNDFQHPQDSRHGLIMMKMVTWKPKTLVGEDNKINNDEAEAVLQFLPLRCHINQRALRFLRAFFTIEKGKKKRLWASDLTEVPPPVFLNFKIKPCRQKINYNPEKVDFEALQNGSIVELVNLSPLNDMVITLKAVNLEKKVGFGEVFSSLASNWIQNISSNQLYKFVTSSSPFQPITSIGTGVADMVILPWDAIQNGNSISEALHVGIRSFAGSVAYEALNVTTKLTGLASRKLSNLVYSSQQRSTSLTLPSRPHTMPRNLSDTTGHAIESIAKGFETANYKIIIIPYREYRRKGATRAAKSVVKGIPVAVLAPIGAASEALSYTLLGARNQIRPDIRKEEEVSLQALHHDF